MTSRTLEFLLIFSPIVLVTAFGRLCLAQGRPADKGVIENRWKLNDVRQDYEDQAQLKLSENRRAWRRRTVETSGIAWDLGDAAGMIRGDADPTAVDSPECVLDTARNSVKRLRLTLLPTRSELSNLTVSVADFRGVSGVTLSAKTDVRMATSDADGGWKLESLPANETVVQQQHRRYLITIKIADAAVADDYFGKIVVTANEKATKRPVQLVLPARLRVCYFTLPPRTASFDGQQLSRKQIIHDDFEEFWQCRNMLTELESKLTAWAKTPEDKAFAGQCRAILQRACSIKQTDVGHNSDYAVVKTELAATLERAQLVLRCDLHSVTIGRNDVLGRAVLNSQLYAPRPGELVVVYPVSVYKSDALVEDTKIVQVVSRDEGLTWTSTGSPNASDQKVAMTGSDIRPTTDAAALASELNHAAALPQDGKTRIEAFSYGWENHPESDRAKLEAAGYYIFDVKDGNAPGVLSIDYRVGMKRSCDGGATWQTTEIKLPRFMPDLRAHMQGIALRDGTYLYPMYGRYDMKKDEYVSSLVLRTVDGGDHWDIHTIADAGAGYFDKTARGPAANGFNETSLVEAPNGDVVAVIRTNDQIELWTATSSDGGKTWSKPRDSGMRGSVPFCVRTSDGCLVCIHSRREARMFPDGTGMFAGISKDNGKTWRSVCIEPCGQQFVDSYAQAVALPGGKVFTVFTAPRGGPQASCGTRFTPGAME